MTNINWARIDNGAVAEIVDLPSDIVPGVDVFPDSWEFVEVPTGENVAAGWGYAGGVFSAPQAVAVPPIIPASVTRRQFFQAAAQEGLITQAEALAIFTTGSIPAAVASAIAAMPSAQQFAAQIAILGGTSFERANPLVSALGAAMGQTSAQINTLFTLAAAL